MGALQVIRRWFGHHLRNLAGAVFAGDSHRSSTYERHRQVDLALGRLQRRSRRQARAR